MIYKWFKRYSNEGLKGLKDKLRSGRPPLVEQDLMIRIRKGLEDSNTGWDVKASYECHSNENRYQIP
ncbi:MAG TPA: helix-turn-helix domain-containing protein [Verrucomicrobiae bacterium]|nr:helix-turn-helix domain-containing protein [Verrucomicrobiae bacterium]